MNTDLAYAGSIQEEEINFAAFTQSQYRWHKIKTHILSIFTYLKCVFTMVEVTGLEPVTLCL